MPRWGSWAVDKEIILPSRAQQMIGWRPRLLTARPLRVGLTRIDGRELKFLTSGLAIVVAAALLRTSWSEDLEFKGDESWTFVQTQAVLSGGALPRVGMPTSQNAPNPVGSIWMFVGLSELFHPHTPVELARIIAWTNVLAIAGVIAFARICISAEMRAAWVWAAALAAVNPLAVVLHRKIWPPSIAPILLLGVLIGWWHRDRRWGAALWGAVVVAVGQLHLSGMFLAAGMAAWALAFDRSRVRWLAWAVGTACTAWPLLFWLPDAAAQAAAHPTGQIRLSNVATLNFFLRWSTEPFGLLLTYSLGNDFSDFLRYPLVAGRPTYSIAGCHAIALAIMGWLWTTSAARAWRQRRQWSEVIPGNRSGNWFTINAVVLGYGGLLTLSCVPIHRHYMLVAFPIMYLWVAAVALLDRRPVWFGQMRGQALLAALCLVQFAISAGFLGYVHDNQRPIRGDYGTPYAAQLRYGLPPR